jgi:hypothetical protein
VLGFEDATSGDEVFAQLALTRIIESASKLDSLRCWRKRASRRSPTGPSIAVCLGMRRHRGGPGCLPPAPPTPGWGWPAWFFMTCHLYSETGAGDGFREPGFSKKRRLDPQITAGQGGFPLMVSAFEGNKAEPIWARWRRITPAT